MSSAAPRHLTYRAAGVDIEAKEAILARLRDRMRSTFRPEVLGSGAGFGGLFRLAGYRDPVLVSTIDGVGTKTRLAVAAGAARGVGRDIVSHGANDVLAEGAAPLFMLDYIAAARLDPEVVAQIVEGIVEACRDQGIALVGGETAEMPGVYAGGEIDVVGCTVGVVERDRLITGEKIRPGDALIGLASSGLHTNGYSLARAALVPSDDPAAVRAALRTAVPELGSTLQDALLRPHRAYARAVLPLCAEMDVRGIAHITGGGIPGNLIRILPEGCRALLARGRWPVPPLFALIQQRGGVADDEMFRAFNMGLGLVLAVPPGEGERAVASLRAAGEEAWVVGEVTAGARGVEIRA